MNIVPVMPPRTFPVGYSHVHLKHVADVTLESDELVTFRSESAREYDVVRKDWGYYATPSLAGRLRSFGFRPAIMRNKNTRHCFVVLVETSQMAAWQAYMAAEAQELVLWLDDFEAFSALPALDPTAPAGSSTPA